MKSILDIKNFINEQRFSITGFNFEFMNRIISVQPMHDLIVAEIGFEFPDRPETFTCIDEERSRDGYMCTKTVRNEYIRKAISIKDCWYEEVTQPKLRASNIEHNFSLFGGNQSYVTEWTMQPSYTSRKFNEEHCKDILVRFLLQVQMTIEQKLKY